MNTPPLSVSLRRASVALLLASSLGLAPSAFAQQSILYNFDTSQADTNNNFTSSRTASGVTTAITYGPGSGTTGAWIGSDGIGNSGHVDNFATNLTTIYNEAITTSGIQTFTISAFIKTKVISNDGGFGTTFASVGFSGIAAVGASFAQDATAEMFGVQIATPNNDTAGLSRWQVRTDTTTGAPATAVVGSTFTLESNTWYRIDVTYTKSSAVGTWNFVTSITPFGVNGTTEGAVLSTASGSFLQSGAYAAENLFGAVHFRDGFGLRIAKLDNLSIVTEQRTHGSTDILYDFNLSQASTNSAFTTSNNSAVATTTFGPGAGTVGSWFGTQGVGNSGYVDNFSANVTSIFNTPINTTNVDSFTVSSFVATGLIDSPGFDGTVFATVGFSDLAGVGASFSQDANAEMFGVQLASASATDNFLARLRLRTDTVAGAAVITNVGSTFTLTSNTWYRLSTTYTKSPIVGTWDFVTNITPFTNNGTTEGAVLASTSGSFIQSSTYSDDTLYGALQFRGGGFGLRLTALDNFAIKTVMASASSPFEDFSTANGLQNPWLGVDPLLNGEPGADPDSDGLANVVEFLLGEDPRSGAIINPPTAASVGSNLVFVFRLSDEAASYAPAIWEVEHTSDLASSWTVISSGAPEVSIGGDLGGYRLVTVTIPKSAATRLFARLRVTIP